MSELNGPVFMRRLRLGPRRERRGESTAAAEDERALACCLVREALEELHRDPRHRGPAADTCPRAAPPRRRRPAPSGERS